MIHARTVTHGRPLVSSAAASIAAFCPAPSREGWRVRPSVSARQLVPWRPHGDRRCRSSRRTRSEEHTSELQSLMRISYAVFCLKKKKHKKQTHTKHTRRHTVTKN